ncbi:MAG TPA: aminotransferase DegT [Blastocatellia bacterium]|nr:aminotransferase DegT [Blastocatellia bacterium]
MLNVTQTFLPPLEEYAKLLEPVWESKWLTNRGMLVCDLEQRLCEYLGVPNMLAVSNGTIALQLAIKALGLKGEIITTPFSYVATVSSIVWEGCTPVFVDIDPIHLTIDENKIEEAITDKTSAILATHVYGNPCNVEAIEEIASRHGLKVIYDAAHCFGVKYKGRSILKHGDVSTLSFHATKLFHTGEGGGIVTANEEIRKTIFDHHNFGHNGPEEFFGLGINGKMSEINAAMGLAVLEHIDDIIARRKSVCEAYDAALANSGVALISLREGTEWNFSYYPVIFESEERLLEVKNEMNKKDIFPRRYFYPTLNRLPYLPYSELPVAEDISRRVLCLPLSAAKTHPDLGAVAELVTAMSANSNV